MESTKADNLSEPKRRRTETRSITAASKSTLRQSATGIHLSDETSKPKSSHEIRRILGRIDKGLVQKHFLDKDSTRDENENDAMDGCAPFLAAENVSRDAFRQYYEPSLGEGLPFTVRFLELSDDGRLWIVEIPSTVHETVGNEFEKLLSASWGQAMESCVASLMHVTVTRRGQMMEADRTYCPRNTAEHIVRQRPQNCNVPWITFVAEVGRTQSLESLRKKTLLWYECTGIQYILLMKVNAQANHMTYEFYDVMLSPLTVNLQNQTVLPPATISGNFRHGQNDETQLIALDNRRILGIPPSQPLPNGVDNDVTNVDLCIVLRNVILTLSSIL